MLAPPLRYLRAHYTQMHRPTLSVCALGQVPYMPAYALQCATVEAVQQGRLRNALYLVEHPHVYTAGRRIKNTPAEEIRRLNRLGAEYHEIQRGGQLTYHGPGQLVGYPIINLSDFNLSVKEYVAMLENVLIEVCAQYGIQGTTSPHTGVWVREKKIAALGLQIQHNVSMHGFALNVRPDLSFFNHIVPCGLPGTQATSILAETGATYTLAAVADAVQTALANALNTHTLPLASAAPDFVHRHIAALLGTPFSGSSKSGGCAAGAPETPPKVAAP